MNRCLCPALVVAGITCLSLGATAQDAKHEAIESPFGTWVEEDFPFFSHTIDARHLGGDWPKDNLTPRGLVFDAGHGVRVCFDPDLLRVALAWRETEKGEYLSMDGMGPGSYRVPNQKASAGQEKLPRPKGTPISATGIHPGWWIGDDEPPLVDPRERSVDSAEVGLGPVAVELGRFEWVADNLGYRIGDTEVTEGFYTDQAGELIRGLHIQPHAETLTLVLGKAAGDVGVTATEGVRLRQAEGGVWLATFPATDEEAIHHIGFGADLDGYLDWIAKAEAVVMPERWPETVTTRGTLADETSGLVRDEIALPVPNPWKRNVRLSAMDFFSDGRAAVCTFDGDVWIVSGLEGDLEEVTWRRFTSGLHDPQGLEIVDDEIYVFDRNGIWNLGGLPGKRFSHIDVHRMFCNLVPQTAETREFAMDLYAKPGGGFYIAKGGQVSSTRGLYNGTAVEISADGKSIRRIADGFRMPYIGVDPETGLLTASDQQGHWKPATPIHIVRDGEYYGFQPSQFGADAVHPKPVTQPALWIPHFVNQSGASQVWLRDAKLGPLNDSLIHIGYNRPEIFKIYLDHPEGGEGMTQGAVAPLMAGFGTGPLEGRVHPIDGSLYLVGFQIWGTVGKGISGLYRLRWAGGPNPVPSEVRSEERGLLLSFDEPLDEAVATSLASYSVDRWNYRRTHQYGSGNFRLDGEPGQETLPVASAYLSEDRRSVFLGVPDMQPVHSMRLTYRLALAGASEAPAIRNAYLTVHELRSIDLADFGFPDGLDVDLTAKAGAAVDVARVEPSVEEGRKAAELFGCIACHTTDGTRAVAADPATVVGPTWKGLFGSKREFTDGTDLRNVDEVYLRESIVDPGRRVPKGFETETTGVGMPSYLGVLKDWQIDSIILYIESLADRKK